MSRKISCFALLAIGTASMAHAADAPSPNLTPQPGKPLCFTRNYDEPHLRTHPNQQVLSIKVLLSSENPDSGLIANRVLITLKGDADSGHWSNGGNCTAAGSHGTPVHASESTSLSTPLHCRFDDFRGVFKLTSRRDGSVLLKTEEILSVYSDTDEIRKLDPREDGVLKLFPGDANHCGKEPDGGIDGYGLDG